LEGIILAGGFGTRLRSRVADLPKPMADIAGRPFLALLLDYLADQGFRRIVLSVGYRHQAIVDFFGQRYGAIELAYVVEAEPLGTGGAIRYAIGRASGDPVWVLNGDTFLALDYRAMARFHAERGWAEMTMAVRRFPDVSRYGTVDLDGDRVAGFASSGPPGPGFVNSGVYLMSRALLDGIELPPVFSFERDLLPVRAKSGVIAAFTSDAWFIDIGVPEDYDRAQTELGKRARRSPPTGSEPVVPLTQSATPRS
jgi:D-glycero-alpha-D-manno-heptose 1-phosphate guanylyltransferase